MNRSDRLVGNRLALVGTALYFLEWVAIAFLPEVADGSLFGAEPEVVVAAYRGHSGVIAFAAGWFGIVLLGRVLFAVALRKAFRDSGRDSLLVDFAVGAMIVSVTMEIASFGPAAAAGWLADTRPDESAIVALEAAGSLLFFVAFVPIGVSILAASAGMLGSDVFPRWLGVVGVLAGVAATVGGVIQVAGAARACFTMSVSRLPMSALLSSGFGSSPLSSRHVDNALASCPAPPPDQG